MTMAYVFSGMIAVSVIFSILTGQGDALASQLMAGADSAVRLCIGLCGTLVLWSGLMEVMRRAGLQEKLAALLRPALCRLIPEAGWDGETLENCAANVSANLLGLGNAATPLGIAAVTRMHKLAGNRGVATDGICMLIVLNAGSLQIIPASVAALRAAEGSAAPFDILPAVWLASLLSCAAGVVSAKIFVRTAGRRDTASPDLPEAGR